MTSDGFSRPLRIALVLDALFPVTMGGAERWFTALAAELAGLGHEVTYLTTGRGAVPTDLPFSVHAVVRSDRLYTSDGRRRLVPSVLFGLASGWWLRRNRGLLDAVYVHQTPLFSVVAARVALGRRVPWAVEWIEWWTRDYWRSYAPGFVGWAGWLVQRTALRATPRATVFARATESRLRAERPGLRIDFMPGQLLDLAAHASAPPIGDVPLVLVVGRLVPEKHVDAAIDAVEVLARTRPVRARVIGQGPLLDRLRAQAADCNADVQVLGPVDQEVLEASYSEAAVLQGGALPQVHRVLHEHGSRRSDLGCRVVGASIVDADDPRERLHGLREHVVDDCRLVVDRHDQHRVAVDHLRRLVRHSRA